MSLCTTIALAVGLYTTHIGGAADLNEDNHLVGVQCNGFTYSHYINSYHHSSHVIGYDHPVFQHKGNKIGVVPSLITGYGGEGHLDPLPFPIVYGQVGPIRINWMLQAVHINLQIEIDL